MIIVADGLDITFYDSIEDAEKYLEAIDVNDGVYEIFTEEGLEVEQLTLEVRNYFLKIIPYMSISYKLKIGKLEKSNRLRDLLIRSISYLDKTSVDLTSLKLADLIELGQRYFKS
jgi:hypothetical protein